MWQYSKIHNNKNRTFKKVLDQTVLKKHHQISFNEDSWLEPSLNPF